MTFSRILRGVVLKGLYPLFMFFGTFFKGRREAFQRTVVRWNNSLVKRERPRTKKILVLLPHCLQVHECDVRITHNIYNCKRCGRCNINGLIDIAEERKLTLFVATGGSLARKIVAEMRPEAIVAVACERDLSSGLVDTYPIPIIGVWNERPFGPCYDTKVNLEKVREAILFFSEG